MSFRFGKNVKGNGKSKSSVMNPLISLRDDPEEHGSDGDL